MIRDSSITALGQGSSSLALDDNEVHVWRMALDAPENQSCHEVLSPDERARAARFYFDRDRRRFAVARSFLRCTLAGYLGISPSEVLFRYTDYGKPFLDGPLASTGLQFNLAHSHELALLAVAMGHEVGIDLEFRRLGFASDTIAEHFFAPEEVQEIRSRPLESQEAAFFRCWTRKEAYIKARGQGLSIPLREFVVATGEVGEGSTLLSTEHEPSAVSRWWVCDLAVAEGYTAAIAFAAGKPLQVILQR